MKRKIVIMLIVIAGSFGILSAQQTAVMVSGKPGWHKIGETTVDFQKDRDEVKVLGADRFIALKFMVTNATIDLQDLEVWFENGTKQDVQVRTPIEMGKESRVIDLPGVQSSINKIVFVYKTLSNRKDTRAHVEIYGLKAESNTAVVKDDERTHADRERMERERMKNPNNPSEGMHDRKGWVKVGEASADLTKDRDVINVANYNRFTSMKFFVTGASLEIMDLNVWFANGEKQNISVRSTIKEGGESRLIDLDGKTREIKRIEFVYKTAPGQRGDRANVEIWAKGSMNVRDATGNVNNNNNTNYKDNNTSNSGVIPKPVVDMNDKPGWHKIAENIVAFKNEKDEIAILGADRYAKLKFKVTDAGIEISDMTITYEDGTKQDVAVMSAFKEGQESRVIDVPGREKDIAKISFVYKTIPNQGKDKAHVEIWGMKTNANKAVGEHQE